MKIRLHGTLRDRYGPGFDIHADTVAEAVRGLSMQLPDWPRDLQIEIPGFADERLLNEPTDVREIDLVPAMFGGGGKFGKILLGAALIAVAIWNPGIGGMILSQAGVTAVASVGIAMMLGGVMGLFMKAPSVSKSEDPPASKYFGLNDNTVDNGTPITMAYGRIKLFGHWLSLQSDADKMVVGVFPGSPT